MRISLLSEQSDVTVASIKFYLRQGLLFAGESSSATQTEYDARHVARLRLIRALIDVGGLSVAAAKAVLAAIDNDAMPIVYAFGIAQHAVTASLASSSRPSDESLAEVAALKAERGWQTFEENPGEPIVARVLDAFRAIGRPDTDARDRQWPYDGVPRHERRGPAVLASPYADRGSGGSRLFGPVDLCPRLRLRRTLVRNSGTDPDGWVQYARPVPRASGGIPSPR